VPNDNPHLEKRIVMNKKYDHGVIVGLLGRRIALAKRHQADKVREKQEETPTFVIQYQGRGKLATVRQSSKRLLVDLDDWCKLEQFRHRAWVLCGVPSDSEHFAKNGYLHIQMKIVAWPESGDATVVLSIFAFVTTTSNCHRCSDQLTAEEVKSYRTSHCRFKVTASLRITSVSTI
jgi:hypothetical protein